MTRRTFDRIARPGLAAAAAVLLFACGGPPPASQNEANAGSAPAGQETPAQAAPAAPAPAQQPAAPPRPAPRRTQAPPVQAPKPAPKPAPIVKTLGAGTEVDVALVDAASSKTSQVGQAVRVRVTKPVQVDGITVIPAESVITGIVTEAVPLKKIGGQASLGLKFTSLETPGGNVHVDTSLELKGKSETGKDAGTIAGATAGGAILGRLLAGKNDKTKGTIIGAVVGAAAGTGAAAATKGKEVELPEGTPLVLHLETPVDITVQP